MTFSLKLQPPVATIKAAFHKLGDKAVVEANRAVWDAGKKTRKDTADHMALRSAFGRQAFTSGRLGRFSGAGLIKRGLNNHTQSKAVSRDPFFSFGIANSPKYLRLEGHGLTVKTFKAKGRDDEVRASVYRKGLRTFAEGPFVMNGRAFIRDEKTGRLRRMGGESPAALFRDERTQATIKASAKKHLQASLAKRLTSLTNRGAITGANGHFLGRQL